MKRFSIIFIAFTLVFSLLFTGCTESEADRYKELQDSMKELDEALSTAFPENPRSFSEVSDYLKEWAGTAGIEIAADNEHYIILRNPATEGMEDGEATTLQCHVDPVNLHNDLDLLSLSLTCLLGPVQHSIIRLIVTENDADNNYIGASTLKKKSITDRHFIHMEMGNSALVCTEGAITMPAVLKCSAGSEEPKYTNAYRIDFTIPKKLNPYSYDKASSYPNPIEIIGNLLASAKSSGRLFEIASFTSEHEEGYIPHHATAIVVIDDNNVESFMKRFESSHESMEKKFKDLVKEQKKSEDEPTEDIDPETLYSYTITETELPKKVLVQKGSDNIISLLYTLQTGIVSQNEESGEIMSVAYIQSISTANEAFNLNVRMRGKSDTSIKELSDTYLITSGLCDVSYKPGTQTRLWSAADSGALSDFFYRAVDLEKDKSPTTLSRTECDVFGPRGKNLDMIYYRVNKDHRKTAIKYTLAYFSGEDVPE